MEDLPHLNPSVSNYVISHTFSENYERYILFLSKTYDKSKTDTMEDVKGVYTMFTLDFLNKEQREAAEYINGPLLVIVGAGTGKTAMMVNRAANMIHKGIQPQNILMLTFTNKAANEMKKRVGDVIADTDDNGDSIAKRITACTFHSFCALLLRRYGERIGLSSNFSIITPNEEGDAIALVKAENPCNEYKGKGFPSNPTVAGIISRAVNKNLKISQVMADTKYKDFTPTVVKIAEYYEIYKQDNQLVSYDDLLTCVNQLLSEFPEVCAQIADRYKYIMVDEYQDTNKPQEEMLLYLFAYTKNIAVVGDDMQSLYGFRGAEVENIIQFDRKFHGCKTIYLAENYRSTQQILDVANVVSSHATEGFPKKLVGLSDSGVLPQVIRPDNQNEEASKVMDIICQTHQKGVPYREICVLVRNSSHSAKLEAELNRAKIAFDKYGGLKFFDLSYVQDVVSILKLVVNPYDELAWFRTLKTLRGIGDVFARRIASGCRQEGLSYLLSKKHSKKKYYDGLQNLYRHLHSISDRPLTDIVSDTIQYYISVRKDCIENMDTDEANRTECFVALIMIEGELEALTAMAEAYIKLDEFLDDISLDNKTENGENETDNLIVSTIHSAKGLEFDTVIIMDCVDLVFPKTDVSEIGSPEDNEELRCFYVAVTRAKNSLYIMAPYNVFRYNGWIMGNLSHFMNGTSELVDCDEESDAFEQLFYRNKPSSYRVSRRKKSDLWC